MPTTYNYHPLIKKQENLEQPITLSCSRRGMIKYFAVGALTLATTPTLVACSGSVRANSAYPRRPPLVYVGTYMPNGRGIHSFQMDPTTGALTPLTIYQTIQNPSWLTLDPSQQRLYAVSEIADYNGNHGAISSFTFNPTDGILTLINTVDSQGGTPVYLSLHTSQRYLFVANYAEASIAVFSILPDGSLGAVTDVQALGGPLGPSLAVDAPAGSFASSGHEASHAHMVHADPSGRFILATDLGSDRIFIWRFDMTVGKLIPNQPAFVQTSAGAGPRHFVFHPNGYVYLATEEASTIVVYAFDQTTGTLTAQQSISTLPDGFLGTNYGLEAILSPDGRFLYAANRLHNSITIFSIAHNGRLKLIGNEWTRGDYPRNIKFDLSGQFLYVCNQRSDMITTFRLNPNGTLQFTGLYCAVGSPASISFYE